MVGHHDAGFPRGHPGLLRVAVPAERAALGAEAFPGAHRHLAPGPVVHARHELVAVAGRGLGRPLVHPLDLLADRGGRAPVEQHVAGILRRARLQPVQAEVVAAALQDREVRFLAEQRFQRLGQPRQVPVDQLALQGDRGGSHHDGAAAGQRVRDRRHQVGQGLAGAGARLDREVLTGADGPLDRLGHRDLPGPLGPADPGDGRGQQVRHGWQRPGSPPWPGRRRGAGHPARDSSPGATSGNATVRGRQPAHSNARRGALARNAAPPLPGPGAHGAADVRASAVTSGHQRLGREAAHKISAALAAASSSTGTRMATISPRCRLTP